MTALKFPTRHQHALKIEALDISLSYANEIEACLRDFASDLGYSSERIEALECRSRDGFSPWSHNKGGIGCVAFMDQYYAESNGTGFENCDETLERYYQHEFEMFCEDNSLTTEEATKRMHDDRDGALMDSFDEYRRQSEDTVLFGLDMMLTSESTLNLRFTVCAKDSPYHRKYDDLVEFDITFKSINGLNQKLGRIMKSDAVKCFMKNLREAY